jgi:hypothetical protein
VSARVRTHKVRLGGTTYRRRAHTRATTGSRERLPVEFKLRPRRAWHNARRSRWAAQRGKRAKAALYASAAVTEILAFTVFKGVGSLLAVAGVALFLLGGGMRGRT